MRSAHLRVAVFASVASNRRNGSPASRMTPPTQPNLMAFHTCATSATECMNPSNPIVQLAQSVDTVSWSLIPGWQSYSGSVPDVFRRGNTIYVYSTSGLLRSDATTGETTTASASGASASVARIGASCSRVGATTTSGKTTLVCKKVGKKTVWAKR